MNSLTTNTWYLVDLINQNKKHFLTNDLTSRFIFIGKSFDCDVKLVRYKIKFNYIIFPFILYTFIYFCLKINEFDIEKEIEDEHALIFYDNFDNKLQIKDLASNNGVQ
jgi:hypothetical protein